MKKSSKNDVINLFFSAFLIIAFIVCAHFFTMFARTLSQTAGYIISILIYAVFGFLVFYATRVGEGKAIKRFSLVTLIVMVLPSLYIIIASLAPGMPFNDVFASAGETPKVIVTLACIALGYGIPYTFLSGFETAKEDAPVMDPTDSASVDGGIEADIADAEETSMNTEADTAEEPSIEPQEDTAEEDNYDGAAEPEDNSESAGEE